MTPTAKPERYVVYWQDWEKYNRLSKERGCESNDIDPSDFEESRDFVSLKAAQHFYAQVEQFGAVLEERLNFRWNGWDWDWEQEPVENPWST